MQLIGNDRGALRQRQLRRLLARRGHGSRIRRGLGCHQEQRADEIRPTRSQLNRHVPADRHAAHDRAAPTLALNQGGNGVGQLLDSYDVRCWFRQRGLPEAWKVDRDQSRLYPSDFRSRKLGAEQSSVNRKSVQEDDRPTFTSLTPTQVYGASLPAASSIASTIFRYDPQRQMLPDR